MKPSGSPVCWEIFGILFNFVSNLSVQILFFLDSVLEDYMFLEIYPFFPGCPIFWNVTVSSYNPSYFCSVGCHFSFISDFTYLGPLFSLVNLVKGLSILLLFSKNQHLVSLTSFITLLLLLL